MDDNGNKKNHRFPSILMAAQHNGRWRKCTSNKKASAPIGKLFQSKERCRYY